MTCASWPRPPPSPGPTSTGGRCRPSSCWCGGGLAAPGGRLALTPALAQGRLRRRHRHASASAALVLAAHPVVPGAGRRARSRSSAGRCASTASSLFLTVRHLRLGHPQRARGRRLPPPQRAWRAASSTGCSSWPPSAASSWPPPPTSSCCSSASRRCRSPCTCMAGSDLRRLRSQESAMKYFVLGAFSSAFFLYGIALIYGATGTTNLDRHLRVPADHGPARGQAAAGRHGPPARRPRRSRPRRCRSTGGRPTCTRVRPTPVTGFFASAAKAAAFAALLRVFVETFSTYQDDWQPARCTPSPCSPCWSGAVLAIVQTNVKRMMAYSSISHAGFILVGVEVATADGISAVAAATCWPTP